MEVLGRLKPKWNVIFAELPHSCANVIKSLLCKLCPSFVHAGKCLRKPPAAFVREVANLRQSEHPVEVTSIESMRFHFHPTLRDKLVCSFALYACLGPRGPLEPDGTPPVIRQRIVNEMGLHQLLPSFIDITVALPHPFAPPIHSSSGGHLRVSRASKWFTPTATLRSITSIVTIAPVCVSEVGKHSSASQISNLQGKISRDRPINLKCFF
mmetsp:Transcript_149561/g.278884  ORF Transcript_149561/g.278884 Transcript_149561/m.278884 type:complete len:211 (+) Transcript_149561:435-1067(+)